MNRSRLVTLLLCAPALVAQAPVQAARSAQLADLAVVRTEYLAKEMAYSPDQRRQAAATLIALEKRAGRMTHADLLVGLARIGGLADNGHSGIRFRDPAALPRLRLPVRLLWFDDALVIARAHGTAADLVGATVTMIEGLKPPILYRRLKPLVGGSDINRRKHLAEFIESEGVLKSLGLARRADRLTFTVRMTDGREITRQLAMIEQSRHPTAEFERLWAPQPVPDEVEWVAANRTANLPVYLQEADRPFRLVDMPEADALYVQFRSNEDEEGFSIAEFLKSVERRIAEDRRGNLIVDLRFDVGGNLLTTMAFMRALPLKVRGRTALLVGRYTYSAGIISAAFIKRSGDARVTVIGEELGDRLHFWSEGAVVRLPHSRLGMRYTNGQFDLSSGCSGKPACLDHLVDVNFVSLVPEIYAPLTSADWLAGRDPGLAAALAELRAARE